MVTRDHIGSFLEAVYEDSALKNRFVLWAFVVLVFPTAVLVALGLPEKPVYIIMSALLFPLQFVLFLLWRREAQSKAEAGMFRGRYPITKLTGTKPEPVIERTTAQSYASMNLATLLMAGAIRPGGRLSDDVPSQIFELPGLRIDRNSISNEGPDVVFRAWLKQDDGSEMEVWVRAETRSPRNPKGAEEILKDALERVGQAGNAGEYRDALAIYGATREDVMRVGLMLVSARSSP